MKVERSAYYQQYSVHFLKTVAAVAKTGSSRRKATDDASWLAKLAGVARSAVLNAERRGDPAGLASIVRVLEAEGAEFINGEQEAVRLRKAKPEDAAPPTAKAAPKAMHARRSSARAGVSLSSASSGIASRAASS
jgi:hypothetical protein